MAARVVHLIVEGDRALRPGFSQLFGRVLGPLCRQHNTRLQIETGGSNSATFELFVDALRQNKDCLLLIDADELLNERATAKQHLQRVHGWPDLARQREENLHLMVAITESWLVCDPTAWHKVYRKGFDAGALPAAQNIETVDKQRVMESIKRSVRDTSAGKYGKTTHAVALLEQLDHEVVGRRAPHFRLLVDELARRIAAGGGGLGG